MNSASELSIRANEELELIILPTEQCNFRCFYCYEKFERGAISDALLQSLERLVHRRVSELKRLRVAWFGGEPLLEWKRVGKTTRYMKNLCRNADVSFGCSITTNAFLLNRKVSNYLNEAGITGYQITIDAGKSVHDRIRVTRTGQPTFDQIFDNLCALLETTSADILLRIHYGKDTKNQLFEFLKGDFQRLPKSPRLTALVRPIVPLGGPNNGAIKRVSIEEQREIEAIAAEIIGTDIMRFSDPAAPKVCYAAKPNAFVIRSDGELLKCTVALDNPMNIVGRLSPDGDVSIMKDKLLPWLKPYIAGDLTACQCPADKVLSVKQV